MEQNGNGIDCAAVRIDATKLLSPECSIMLFFLWGPMLIRVTIPYFRRCLIPTNRKIYGLTRKSLPTWPRACWDLSYTSSDPVVDHLLRPAVSSTSDNCEIWCEMWRDLMQDKARFDARFGVRLARSNRTTRAWCQNLLEESVQASHVWRTCCKV
jgi:hypothetical protein